MTQLDSTYELDSAKLNRVETSLPTRLDLTNLPATLVCIIRRVGRAEVGRQLEAKMCLCHPATNP